MRQDLLPQQPQHCQAASTMRRYTNVQKTYELCLHEGILHHIFYTYFANNAEVHKCADDV
jgi:hypothetical protein